MTTTQTTNERNKNMTSQTKAVQTIINNITRSLKAACVSCPDIMMDCILTEAQELVNDKGYVWDVALAIACKIYPCTKYCGQYAYEA